VTTWRRNARYRLRRVRPRRLALLAAVVAAVLGPGAESRAAGPTITVMTRNVFLGADPAPAINAPGIGQAIDGAGAVWNELQGTKFVERAVPLAREIKRSNADLVGLQEVALWRKQTPSDGGAPPISPLPSATPATAIEQDFLAILRRELGSSYRVAVVQEEFDAELPVDADGSDATGTGPLAGFGADFDARLTMRDVILVKRGSKVGLGKTRTGHFKTRYETNVGGIAIPVDRGWASVEARIGKRRFRFLDTHLEAFGDPKIREAQAKELTRKAVVTGRDKGERTPSGLWPSDPAAWSAGCGCGTEAAYQRACGPAPRGMRFSRGLGAALIAVAAFTAIAPAADALPPIKIRLPHIDVPNPTLRPLRRQDWAVETRAYDERLAAAGSEEALSAEETLRQIRAKQRLDVVERCLSAAATGVRDGTIQSYVDTGQAESVTDAASTAIIDCVNSRVSGFLPQEGVETVGSALADELVTAVENADPGSSSVYVPIDWSTVSYAATGPGYPTNSGGGGGQSPWPIVGLAGGLFLAALVVRGIIRRS